MSWSGGRLVGWPFGWVVVGRLVVWLGAIQEL